MDFLHTYEHESSNFINANNSCFVISDKLPSARIQNITAITSFVQKDLPIKYLGCQLFVGRKKISYFMDIVQKVEKKLAG